MGRDDHDWIVVPTWGIGGSFVSRGGARLGSDAACTSVRVGVRGLLCWPEREEGLRRYLFQAGQENNLRAPFLMMLEATLGRHVGSSRPGPLRRRVYLSSNKRLLPARLACLGEPVTDADLDQFKAFEHRVVLMPVRAANGAPQLFLLGGLLLSRQEAGLC